MSILIAHFWALKGSLIATTVVLLLVVLVVTAVSYTHLTLPTNREV